MNHRLLKNFFAALFIVATLFSVAHHHNDLKKHADCSVCHISTNLQNIDDTPEPTYLSILYIAKEKPQGRLFLNPPKKHKNTYSSRAPPSI
jgi:hypothetical protein